MYKSCSSILSCSQTRNLFPTRQGISLYSLLGLSLRGRGQFLVLLNQSEQDQEPLSALALDCLCQTGLTPWSVSSPFHRTIMLFLLLCKIMFPGHVGALCPMLLHCTALHCTALHCTALRSTAQHCAALHCTALHYTALHCTVLHYTLLLCTALNSTGPHCIELQYGSRCWQSFSQI